MSIWYTSSLSLALLTKEKSLILAQNSESDGEIACSWTSVNGVRWWAMEDLFLLLLCISCLARWIISVDIYILLTFQLLFISWGGIDYLESSYYSLDSYSPLLILFIEGGRISPWRNWFLFLEGISPGSSYSMDVGKSLSPWSMSFPWDSYTLILLRLFVCHRSG